MIAFGDVSGKGAAAALYGALISGLLRTLTPRRRSPAMLMQSLNEALLERKVDAVYATLDGAAVGAAHASHDDFERRRRAAADFPRRPDYHGQGRRRAHRTAGTSNYDEVSYQAESGDTLLLFSDGVEDQLNANEEHFGRSRVQRLLTKHDAETPARHRRSDLRGPG